MPGFERRRYDRIPVFLELEVRNLATGQSFRARSVDICRKGIGFYADQFVPAGTHVRIAVRLKRNGQEKTSYVMGQIAHTRTEGDGAIMGASFDTELDLVSQPELCEVVDRS